MDTIDYLLVCIAEEGAEVAQAACKCNRFGIDDKWGSDERAIERLAMEFVDLEATFDILMSKVPELATIMERNRDKWSAAKKEKLAVMMTYSARRGKLDNHPKHYSDLEK